MNINGFAKQPFKERLKNTGYLLKNSFTIMGKDKDIKTPMIRMAVWTIITRLLFFVSLLPLITAAYAPEYRPNRPVCSVLDPADLYNCSSAFFFTIHDNGPMLAG